MASKEKPRPEEAPPHYGSATAFLAIVSYFIYFAYRFKYIHSAVLGGYVDISVAYLYLLVECGLTLHFNIDRILHVLAHGKKPQLSRAIAVAEDDLPFIDVLIMCCGEDITIILDTVRAACSQKYPESKYRVFLSDDGASTTLHQHISGLSAEFNNLRYITRGKDKPADYKVGNLSFAVAHTAANGEKPSEFIAGLDADLIVDPLWLRIVASHIFSDENLAMVAPPQYFYNIPAQDSLYQLVFSSSMGLVSACLGVGKSVGSGYLPRRQALQSVGGIPSLVAEDTTLSFRLMAAGWKVSYIFGQPLQFGVLPTTISGHMKQRTRWALSNLEMAIAHGFWLSNKTAGALTFGQRAFACSIGITAAANIFLTIPLLLLLFLLISGSSIITFSSINELRTLLLLVSFRAFSEAAYDIVLSLRTGFRSTQRYIDLQYWQSPYFFFAFLRAKVLPEYLGGGKLAPEAAGSLEAEAQELKSGSANTPWSTQWKKITQSTVKYHILYFALLLAGILIGIYRSLYTGIPDATANITSKVVINLLTRVFWPPLIWYTPLRMSLTPLWFLLSQTQGLSREELLDRDEATGVAFPKQEVLLPKPVSAANLWSNEHHRHLALTFTGVAFCMSFLL